MRWRFVCENVSLRACTQIDSAYNVRCIGLLDTFSLYLLPQHLNYGRFKATVSDLQYTKILKRNQSPKNSSKHGQYYVYRNPGDRTPNLLVKKQLRQNPNTAESTNEAYLQRSIMSMQFCRSLRNISTTKLTLLPATLFEAHESQCLNFVLLFSTMAMKDYIITHY